MWRALGSNRLLHCFYTVRTADLHRLTSSWSSQAVRSTFIEYFKEREHEFVPSSSVLPGKGQGTYFTNAGMNQFKPLFLGTVEPESKMAQYTRVVNSQKCVRVGGKHNDLDDVGKDLTHHTFFEMLGTWSFGDYFKEEACALALGLLMGSFKLPLDRLYFTYYGGNSSGSLPPDLECRDIWLSLGVPPERVLPFGSSDNFWDMGDTGPCGPCTEIHYDHVGGRDAAHLVNSGSPEVVEIWNLVFMQFDRQPGGGLELLPKCHVDTGMGLERMTAVMQGKSSNYDTDLFTPMFSIIHRMTGAAPYGGQVGEADIQGLDYAYRVLADHTRMFCVAISDGLMPGRDGLQHKLRQLMLRASLMSQVVLKGRLGLMQELVACVVKSLGPTYPNLMQQEDEIKQVVGMVESQFWATYTAAIHTLNKLQKTECHNKVLTAQQVLHLQEGFYGTPIPMELLEVMAKQRGLTLDLEGLTAIKSTQQMHSKAAMKSQEALAMEAHHITSQLQQANIPPTDDRFKYLYKRGLLPGEYAFHQTTRQPFRVLAVLEGGQLTEEVGAGVYCGLVLDKTCFYAEGGGQAPDNGTLALRLPLRSGCSELVEFEVDNVQRVDRWVVHYGKSKEGPVMTDLQGTPMLDETRRTGLMRNHTCTHLVNAGLRSLLGSVHQRGSAVSPSKFTFDFSCVTQLTAEHLLRLERAVEANIFARCPVLRQQWPLEQALAIPQLVTMPDEVYPSSVTVVTIQGIQPMAGVQAGLGEVLDSCELCGGTHVANTEDIVAFSVLKLAGVSQGTKRITCVTGEEALQAQENGSQLKTLMSDLEEAVKEESDLDSWPAQVKAINQLLQEELLPKLVRDEIFRRHEVLGEKIRTALNKRLQHEIEQELEALKANRDDGPLLALWKHDLKQTQKVLGRWNSNHPTLLVLEGDRRTTLMICAPKVYGSIQGLVDQVQSIASEHGGVKHSTAKCSDDKVLHLLTVKGRDLSTPLFKSIQRQLHVDASQLSAEE